MGDVAGPVSSGGTKKTRSQQLRVVEHCNQNIDAATHFGGKDGFQVHSLTHMGL